MTHLLRAASIVLWRTVCVAMVFALTGCATKPLGWDKTEIIMAGSLGVLNAVDGYQTCSLTSTRHYKEANPIIAGILGDYPSPAGMAGLKAGAFAIELAIAHFLPRTHRERKLYLGIFDAGQLGVVIWNSQF